MIKKGFTLLEMLVVIGIIAILVTMGFAAYSTVQKKSRDARRQGDLKAAQQVMEQCYSINSFQYPDYTTPSAGKFSVVCPTDANLNFTIVDPLNTGTYIYTIARTTTSYTITAPDLEASADTFSVSNQQ